MSKKTSAAWQHFVIVDDGKQARCNHCNRTVVIANGSTGNMFRHMKLRHPSLSIEKYVNRKRTTIPNIIRAVRSIASVENEEHSDKVIPCTNIETHHITSTNKAKFQSPSKNITNSEITPKFPSPSKSLTNSEVSPKFSSLSENVIDSANVSKFSNTSENEQPVSFFLIQAYDENKRQELDKQLLKIIVKNLIPFSIIENEEFIKLVNMLNPSYTLPSRKTLSNDTLFCMYQSAVDELKCTLKDIESVAMTIDCWKSINNEYFIAFTVHYFNKNLELKSNFLQCFSSLQKFCPIHISLIIDELESNWNLHDKILAVITDGSEEIMRAICNCNLNHIPCFFQILNQIVEVGLVEINPFILKIRNVVQYFEKNSMVLNKFYIIQNEMGLSNAKLVKDIPSRWDTTFNMFISVLKNKVPLLSTIEQLQLNFFELSSVHFNFLESAIKILVIFNSVKVAACSETFFSLSKVPQMIHFLSKHLDNVLKDTKLPSDIIKMGNILKTRIKLFEQLEMNELVYQAVLLDPRFKKRGFPNSHFEEACITLRRNVANVREQIIDVKNEQSSSSKIEEIIVEPESEYFIDMWSEFESKDPSSVQSHTAAASVEVDAFLSDLYLSIDDNPLNYWSNISNQNKFPALFELAKRVLCIPATSVPCQQIYSNDGHIFVKKRKYLPAIRTDKILFLYDNL